MSYTEDTSKYFISYVFKQATAFCLAYDDKGTEAKHTEGM